MDRKQKILTLLAVENDWLTAKKLAQFLQVSTRTIRLDMKQLREADGEDVIIASKKYGYKLANPINKQVNQSVFTNNYDRKQRLFALWQGFYFDGEVDLYVFAERFFVSDSTIINDVATLKGELMYFYHGNCKVFREGENFIFKAVGQETPEQFYHFALKHLQVERLEQFARLFVAIDLQGIYRCCAEVIYDSMVNYNAISLIELAVDIAVIVLKDYPEASLIEEWSNSCVTVVEQLSIRMKQQLSLTLTGKQKNAIVRKLTAIESMAIYEQKLRRTGAIDSNLVDTSIAVFSRFYIPLVDYTVMEPELLHQFFCHLQLARERQRRGFYTMNALLGQLRNRHKLLFEIAKRALREIGLEFDENECAYIVTYLQLILERQINRQAKQLDVSLIVTNSYSNGLFIENCVRQHFQYGDKCHLLRQIPNQIPNSDLIFSTHNLARQYRQVIMLDKQLDIAEQLKIKIAIKQCREQRCRAYFQQLLENFQVVSEYEANNQRPFSPKNTENRPTIVQFQQAVLYQYCREYLVAQGLGGQVGEVSITSKQMSDYYESEC